MCALHDALAKSTAAAGSLAPQSHDPTLLHSQLEQLRALEQELDTKRARAQSLDLENKKLASDQLVSRKALEKVKKANNNLKQAVKALSSAIHQANAALTQTPPPPSSPNCNRPLHPQWTRSPQSSLISRSLTVARRLLEASRKWAH